MIEDSLLKDEKILEEFGSLTLTTKRVVGEENVLRLLFGGLGNIAATLLNMRSSSGFAQGTMIDISLGKIDSTELKIERHALLLIISNILWYATIALLSIIWVWPYASETIAPAVKIVAFILNLATLGFAQGALDAVGSIADMLTTSYDFPIWTFVLSSAFFVVYMLLKNVTVEVYSANNKIFTTLVDFSPTAKTNDAKKFLKAVRTAERGFLR